MCRFAGSDNFHPTYTVNRYSLPDDDGKHLQFSARARGHTYIKSREKLASSAKGVYLQPPVLHTIVCVYLKIMKYR